MGRFALNHRQFGGRRWGLGDVSGRPPEDVLLLYDRLCLGRPRCLGRSRCLLRRTRRRLSHACRFSNSLSLGGGGAPQIFGPARFGGAALGGKPFVFIATLLVAALLLLTPLSRAPLLLIAPSRRAPLLFFASLLLDTLGLGGSGLRCAARVLGRSIRADRARGLLSRAHRLLGGTDRIAGTLCFPGAFGLGGPRGFLSRAHGFLRGASRFGRPLAFERSFRVGLLLRESLGLGDLARLFGGARRILGRALRLFGRPRRFGRPLRLRGALRLERAARFLLCRARFVLRDARLLLRGLGLRRGGIGFARGVGDGSRLAPYVFEQLCEDAAEGFCRQSSRVR